MFVFFIHYALLTAQITIGCCLVLPFLLLLANCFTSIFRKKSIISEELFDEKDYAIIVPAYSQTDSIRPLIDSLLQLNYSNYIIYVVGNKSSFELNSAIDKKVVFLQSPADIKRHVYAYRYAIENFKRPHTHITVVENNTRVDKDYLNELNVQFNKGYQAVQGTNVLQPVYTVSDIVYAAGNIYKQLLTGKILFSLGSSAALTGAGAAFTITLFKQCIIKPYVADEAFTKSLQYEIVNRGYQIAFAPKAILWDKRTIDVHESKHKIRSSIKAWLKNITDNKTMVIKGVTSCCYNRILFGVILMQPSVFITLLLSFICLLANTETHPAMVIMWFFSIVLFVLSFLIAAGYSAQLIRSRKYLPQQQFISPASQQVYITKTKREYSIAS